MVEGVIVICTLLVFMGLIVWTRKSYGMKLDLQQTTRSNTLFYASHGCEGAGGSTEVGGTVDEASSPEVDKAIDKANVANKGAASRGWNVASASVSDTSDWSTVWDVNATDGKNRPMNLQKQGLHRTITAASTVACNEKSYDNDWIAWLEFGADFVLRGGGGVDLFQ